MTEDNRLYSPSTARNRGAILGVLQRYLPDKGKVLEVASGTGEHVIYFAQKSSSELIFQPTDPDLKARSSIDAWAVSRNIPNVRRALKLDTTDKVWPVANFDVVLCINMTHIAPWAATEGLLYGASQVLASGGILYIYGPFYFKGCYIAPSNIAFDLELRERNPNWGIRDVEAVLDLAKSNHLQPLIIEQMPVNNLSLVFKNSP
ncbi:MAG: DUF938 domain-containing protein [Hyphomicrobiaceae bacterium]|nr:DUF938 domain-containing protein [Hyphomicrobiaceae bacterium]